MKHFNPVIFQFRPSRLVAAAFCLGFGLSAQQGPIPDKNLADAVREYVPDLKEGQPVTSQQLGSVIYIRVTKEKSVSSLAGLEQAKSLTTLYISGSPVADLTPLKGLVNLEQLTIEGAKINDLSPLAALPKLTYLNLSNNEIADVKPLAGLKALTTLNLSHNKITDLSPLTGMTELDNVNVAGNQVSDLKPLAGLTKVANLDLTGNQVRDIGALATFTKLKTLYLDQNQISDIAPLLTMAAKDAAGKREFVDLWTVSLRGNPLSAASKKILPDLAKHSLNLMINSDAPAAEPTAQKK